MKQNARGANERRDSFAKNRARGEELTQFNKWVDDWDRAEKLRRFIAVYASESASWPAEKQAQYKAWIEWATRQANRLDPFVIEKPTSVLDRKHELPSL